MEWSKLLPYQGEVPWKIFRKMIIWQTVFIHLCVYMRYSQFKPLRRRIHFSFITKYHKNCSQKPPHDFLAYRCWQYVKSIYIYIYIRFYQICLHSILALNQSSGSQRGKCCPLGTCWETARVVLVSMIGGQDWHSPSNALGTSETPVVHEQSH